jgi:hypothetical protein
MPSLAPGAWDSDAMTSTAIAYASASGRSSWAYSVCLPTPLPKRLPRVARVSRSSTRASS